MRFVSHRVPNYFHSSFNANSVFDEFDRLFQGAAQEPAFRPAYEVEEGDGGYLLSFDLPGLTKEDVKIEAHDGRLRVWGERKKDQAKSETGRRFGARNFGRFEHVFALPKDIDAEKIQAQMENGVLQLAIPKAPKAIAREIPIANGGIAFEQIVQPSTKEVETNVQ